MFGSTNFILVIVDSKDLLTCDSYRDMYLLRQRYQAKLEVSIMMHVKTASFDDDLYDEA